MPNRADVEMLQNAIGNVGNTFQRNRQFKAEQEQAMQRLALEQQMRSDSQQHYAAEEQHFQNEEDEGKARADQASKPKVTTYIADPKNPESGMEFTGTPEQLQTIMTNSAQQGKPLQQFASTPQKDFAATFKVGGATYSFHDPTAADNFRQAAASRGIDVEDEKYGASKGKSPTIVSALDDAAEKRKEADASDDPAESQRLNDYADTIEGWAKKQTSFKPPTIPPNKNETFGYDPQGRKTNATTSYTSPSAVSATGTSPSDSDLFQNMGVGQPPDASPSNFNWAAQGNPAPAPVAPTAALTAPPSMTSPTQPAAQDGTATTLPKPTRAIARSYVEKYGATAKQQLQQDGFDISGYSD